MINKESDCFSYSWQRGFTLLEVMVVVMMIAVLAAIAIPSYQEYVRRAEASRASQEMLRLAQELERYKARNFNYLGFEKGSSEYSVPNTTYTITIVDGNITSNNGTEVVQSLTDAAAVGQKWAMKANANDSNSKKYNFLLNSDQLRCKNRTYSNMSYAMCGTGSEDW